MTPARTDLPAIGDRIAALHGSQRWYFGPLAVVEIRGRIVDARPEYWRHAGMITFTPTAEQPDPLRWNLWSDLSEAEQKEIEGNIKIGKPKQ